MLAERFMHRYARKHGGRVVGITPECMAVMLKHTWPGNVRELQNVIERGVILCNDSEYLQSEHLGLTPSEPPLARSGRSAPSAPAIPDLRTASAIPTLNELERQLIFAALKRCNNNRTHAAKLIGISLRTLRNKLSEYRQRGLLEWQGESAGEDASTLSA